MAIVTKSNTSNRISSKPRPKRRRNSASQTRTEESPRHEFRDECRLGEGRKHAKCDRPPSDFSAGGDSVERGVAGSDLPAGPHRIKRLCLSKQQTLAPLVQGNFALRKVGHGRIAGS